MDEHLRVSGFYRKPTAKDGSCLFRAVAEQVLLCQKKHADVRRSCVNYIRRHRHTYEAFIEGDFDDYIQKLQDPQSWVGQVEISALALLYKRDFIIFQEVGKDPVNITQHGFKEKVVLCFLNENHYDSVYSASYPNTAALCQSVLYELLYERVFGVHQNVLSRRVQGDSESAVIVKVEYNSCDESEEEDLWLRQKREERSSEAQKCMAFPSVRVRNSLSPSVYRNVEYDVWQSSKRAQQDRDFHMAAGMQYRAGDRCQVRLTPAGPFISAVIQAVSPDSGPVSVYIPHLKQSHAVSLKNLRSPDNKSWTKRDKKHHIGRSNTHSGDESAAPCVLQNQQSCPEDNRRSEGTDFLLDEMSFPSLETSIQQAYQSPTPKKAGRSNQKSSESRKQRLCEGDVIQRTEKLMNTHDDPDKKSTPHHKREDKRSDYISSSLAPSAASATPPTTTRLPAASATPPATIPLPDRLATPPDTTLLPSASAMPSTTTPLSSATPPAVIPLPTRSATPPTTTLLPSALATPPNTTPLPSALATPPNNTPLPSASAMPPATIPLPDRLATPPATTLLPSALATPPNTTPLPSALATPPNTTLLPSASATPPATIPLPDRLATPPATTLLPFALATPPNTTPLPSALATPPNTTPLPSASATPPTTTPLPATSATPSALMPLPATSATPSALMPLPATSATPSALMPLPATSATPPSTTTLPPATSNMLYHPHAVQPSVTSWMPPTITPPLSHTKSARLSTSGPAHVSDSTPAMPTNTSTVPNPTSSVLATALPALYTPHASAPGFIPPPPGVVPDQRPPPLLFQQVQFQDPLFPGFLLNEKNEIVPTPSYSCLPRGEDLPKDIQVLRFFFNLGVQAYYHRLRTPNSYPQNLYFSIPSCVSGEIPQPLLHPGPSPFLSREAQAPPLVQFTPRDMFLHHTPTMTLNQNSTTIASETPWLLDNQADVPRSKVSRVQPATDPYMQDSGVDSKREQNIITTSERVCPVQSDGPIRNPRLLLQAAEPAETGGALRSGQFFYRGSPKRFHQRSFNGRGGSRGRRDF
ncbi:OTU domain-containing protein 4 isoform X3 [Denticeps clupeoides]|uniref:OTU domain-containing protein 4 isoform X3 n=1 Tax=Denticeps clupeoides TaxID=299321 RepID=UPI0010A4252F|nr:OTU domain-containing protein 4-like isoform X3 [Denticeps clupeoides]